MSIESVVLNIGLGVIMALCLIGLIRVAKDAMSDSSLHQCKADSDEAYYNDGVYKLRARWKRQIKEARMARQMLRNKDIEMADVDLIWPNDLEKLPTADRDLKISSLEKYASTLSSKLRATR